MKRFRQVYDVELEQELLEEEEEEPQQQQQQQQEEEEEDRQAKADELKAEIDELEALQRELEVKTELRRAKLRRVQARLDLEQVEEEEEELKEVEKVKEAEAKQIADFKANQIKWMTKVKKKPNAYIPPPPTAKRSNSGYPGITVDYYTTKDGETHRRWRVRLNVKGKIKHIGTYKDLDDAIDALKVASQKFLGRAPLRYGNDDVYPYLVQEELEEAWNEMFQ